MLMLDSSREELRDDEPPDTFLIFQMRPNTLLDESIQLPDENDVFLGLHLIFKLLLKVMIIATNLYTRR